MNPAYLTPSALDQFISSALKEDVGDGDHTTLAAVSEDARCQAELRIKDDGILAGTELAGRILTYNTSGVQVTFHKVDGQPCRRGDVAFVAEGNARCILTRERLLLNCMQRMSGIATRTHQLTALLAGTKALLLDTRKTTPHFRLAEKWAVLLGGGVNHRFGLFDQILLKDNHINLAGGVRPALTRAVEYVKRTGLALKVEIEARTLAEVEEVLNTGGADIILLDNMNIDTLRRAVDRIGDLAVTEASGGIAESNLREVAQTGVDYISIGALTHSVKSLDLSLKII